MPSTTQMLAIICIFQFCLVKEVKIQSCSFSSTLHQKSPANTNTPLFSCNRLVENVENSTAKAIGARMWEPSAAEIEIVSLSHTGNKNTQIPSWQKGHNPCHVCQSRTVKYFSYAAVSTAMAFEGERLPWLMWQKNRQQISILMPRHVRLLRVI